MPIFRGVGRGPRLASVLLIFNAALALATTPWLAGAVRVGTIIAALVDLGLAATLLIGASWSKRAVWGRIAVGAVLVLLFAVSRSALLLIALLPLVAVGLALPGRPGWPRGMAALVAEGAWTALAACQAYGMATGDALVGEAVARLQRRISPETVPSIEGRRQPYRLKLPSGSWHVARPAATDDPALDLALSYPRRQARVE